mmetsp:Transcript_18334/g.70830  ORF Transcript_18334/g.70830 Transcript_18334/m.70830 type:complete len:227 (-) Transcript_18334:293-973(-)
MAVLVANVWPQELVGEQKVSAVAEGGEELPDGPELAVLHEELVDDNKALQGDLVVAHAVGRELAHYLTQLLNRVHRHVGAVALLVGKQLVVCEQAVSIVVDQFEDVRQRREELLRQLLRTDVEERRTGIQNRVHGPGKRLVDALHRLGGAFEAPLDLITVLLHQRHNTVPDCEAGLVSRLAEVKLVTQKHNGGRQAERIQRWHPPVRYAIKGLWAGNVVNDANDVR